MHIILLHCCTNESNMNKRIWEKIETHSVYRLYLFLLIIVSVAKYSWYIVNRELRSNRLSVFEETSKSFHPLWKPQWWIHALQLVMSEKYTPWPQFWLTKRGLIPLIPYIFVSTCRNKRNSIHACNSTVLMEIPE